MTAGNIGVWQKKAGDSLAPGDVLVEIETDKAQMDFEFQEEGRLAKVLKESGEKDVAVGSVRVIFIWYANRPANPSSAYCRDGRRRRRCLRVRIVYA